MTMTNDSRVLATVLAFVATLSAELNEPTEKRRSDDEKKNH